MNKDDNHLYLGQFSSWCLRHCPSLFDGTRHWILACIHGDHGGHTHEEDVSLLFNLLVIQVLCCSVARLAALLPVAGIVSPAQLCLADRQYNSLDAQHFRTNAIYGWTPQTWSSGQSLLLYM